MQRFDTARRTGVICRAVSLTCAAVLAAAPCYAQPKIDPSRGAAKAAACASCHGSPQRPPLAGMPTLAGQQEQFLVLQMFLMREGLRDVPQMAGTLKDFSDRDLDEVAAYFSRQTPARGGTSTKPKLHARGEVLAKGMACGSCHLGDYTGQRQVPRVASQREDYLAATLKAYRDNKRIGTDTSMNSILYQVPDTDIDALAHFLAYQ
ncbi:MAG TPA: c-type cytochrome [Burkholderiales bacterium]|jgi:cytochrome c553